MSNKDDERRAVIREECLRRGVRIVQYGRGWWLEGIGVNVVANDLANVTPSDLLPVRIADRR